MSKISDYIKAIMKRSPISIRLHDHISNMRVRNALDILFFPASACVVLGRSIMTPIAIRGGYEHSLSICAILKDEGEYIKEWIDYHKNIIGVEHFYLYDNDSTDGVQVILKPYIYEGIVTYTRISGKKRQHDAYNDALNRYQRKSKFIAFIDLDEFIFTNGQDAKTWFIENLTDKRSALAINWVVFGSSHFLEKQSGGVLETFLWRSKYGAEKNRHIKTICNPRTVLGFINAHFAVYRIGYSAITYELKTQYGAKSDPLEDGFKLFHYFTKSREEFEKKRLKGKADELSIRDEKEFEEHDFNDVYDDRMKAIWKGK